MKMWRRCTFAPSKLYSTIQPSIWLGNDLEEASSGDIMILLELRFQRNAETKGDRERQTVEILSFIKVRDDVSDVLWETNFRRFLKFSECLSFHKLKNINHYSMQKLILYAYFDIHTIHKRNNHMES